MSANKYLQQATGAFQPISWTDVSTSASAPSTNWALTNLTNTLSPSNVSSTTTSSWVSIGVTTQGTSGTWLCIGHTVSYAVGTATLCYMQITDGVTVFGSAVDACPAAANYFGMTCFGIATSPTTNLKFQFHAGAPGIQLIAVANQSGGGLDCGLTVVRIG